MTLTLNLSVAVDVSALAREILDASDPEAVVYGDPLPGVRLDVQRECVANHPLLIWGAVNPAVLIHDCGPNGVRLLAESWEHLHAVCQPTGSRWDVFIEAAEGA